MKRGPLSAREKTMIGYAWKAHQRAKNWWGNGFGLSVLTALAKRHGKGWEDGVFHLGGIHSGHWVLYMPSKTGRELGRILALYKSEKEFLDENS